MGELGIKNENKNTEKAGRIFKGEIRKVFNHGQKLPINIGWKDKLEYLSLNSWFSQKE